LADRGRQLVVEVDAVVYGMSPFGGLITYWNHVLAGLERAGIGLLFDAPTLLKSELPVTGRGSWARSDVFVSTYFTTPNDPDLPSAVVVHDLIYEADPALVEELDPDPSILERKAACIEAASVIVVPTRAVASELRRFYPAARASVEVIPHGIGSEFDPAPDGAADHHSRAALQANDVRRPYLLHVGGRAGHKSFESILGAYTGSEELKSRFDLVVVGSPIETTPAEARHLAHPRGGHVALLGRVGVAELASLMRSAAVLVSGSRTEGFGLPVAEALACGTAVACSAIPAYVENYRELVSFFDPTDARSIEVAILDAAATGEAERRRRGVEIRRRFDWDESVVQLLGVLRTASGLAGTPAAGPVPRN